MDKKFVVEQLRKHHLPYFYEIRFSVEENIVHPHQIQYLLRNQALDDITQGGGWICKNGNEYVGFCMGIFIPDPIIGGLFVKPEYQSQGIGKCLLKKVTEWMFFNGAKEIKLTTDPLSKAEEFYQRQGWKKGELDEYGTQIIYTKQHLSSK
ncbi:putative acetyltransferase [Candidatus Regiella insecticola LSR1]|uniref:Putative acetyltransferase n=1 Tax=Candidatus Regiella insecticola LSR1 TaxID=663321 RepID=E0WV88_9ENTR|nr:GNAT family N-acetyltransferase [Candidatus Regiella insecticola]EFL91080.1 putative acetyltransferase [Candidatus Regiella insecticola LSR1]